jgi:phosphoribosyl 1,2-cyclic phosphate phosphodiesterase
VKLTILGSGGATPTPRPFCQCSICRKARREGEPYRRNCSSLFVDGAFALIDCGEDIGDSLNRRRIERVDNLFITHWHPDHTFGLRPLLEAHFDFLEYKASKHIAVYVPKKVLEDLNQHYPSVSYFADRMKVADFNIIEHEKSVRMGKMLITAIGYEGKDSRVFAYLFQQDGKKALYSPCDTVNFKQRIYDLDLLINECGVFSFDKMKREIAFPALMERIRQLRPKRTVLTHIEETELNAWGWDYLDRMKKQYSDINFDFAYDGMKIKL